MRFLAFIGLLAIIGVILAGGYFFGGFFDVGASWEDPRPVVAALTRVRTASIARRAHDQPPIALDEAANISSGARQFAKYGCSTCHGAPGVGWSSFPRGSIPTRPILRRSPLSATRRRCSGW